jgi:hypothetical protein
MAGGPLEIRVRPGHADSVRNLTRRVNRTAGFQWTPARPGRHSSRASESLLKCDTVQRRPFSGNTWALRADPAAASSSDLEAPPTETWLAASSSANATDRTAIGARSHSRQGESDRLRRQAAVKLGRSRRAHSIANCRWTAPRAGRRKSRDDRLRARCPRQIPLPRANPPTRPSRAESPNPRTRASLIRAVSSWDGAGATWREDAGA